MAVQKHNSSSTWIRGNFIGKGSYGTVSLGIRDSDGGVFAVKSAAKDSPSSIDALEKEIRILRSISSSSPYIVEFYGDDETPTHRNLFLEYVAGGDVASSGGVSDVELIRSYAWCLVVALKSVHSEGVVHCDVKGSNVLLCSESGIAKLADFGSAKISVDDFDQRSKMVPRGSPLWMAPEVVRGESQGFEADIWSLGCTVLEMFTGKPAWQDRGAHTLYQIGYSDDLPEFPARLPDLARDFLEKCLNRDPNLRWSCDQLLQHPFLLPAPSTKIAESSPRSILDWQTLDSSYDDDDHEFEDFDDVPVRATISKLATTAGVNWENDDDGWVEVRGRSKEVEVGTSSEYSDLEKGKVGISRSMEGVNWKDESDGDCDCATWMYLDGDDEVGGGDWGHVGSCDCEQSGEVDSCGQVLATVVFLGFSFFSFLFSHFCILLQILEEMKIVIFIGAITLAKFFNMIPLRSLGSTYIQAIIDYISKKEKRKAVTIKIRKKQRRKRRKYKSQHKESLWNLYNILFRYIYINF